MKELEEVIKQNRRDFHTVVPFDPATDKISKLDLSEYNHHLTEELYSNTEQFMIYINALKKDAGAKYLIGGYNEKRDIYKRSVLFDIGRKVTPATEKLPVREEPRRLHLGIDIWGDAGTKVFAPLGGMMHSKAYHDQFGDYGGTVILQHQLEMVPFYTLYGHLSKKDISTLRRGEVITRGQCFGHFGDEKENGGWPPHLHFQLVREIGYAEGDYPGVCKESEKVKYLHNSPDPDWIINMMRYCGS